MKNFTTREGMALGFLFAGILVGVVALIADLMGGPSWLHAFTFAGGLAFGWGIVTLIQSSHDRRKGNGIIAPEDERLT